MGVAADQDRQVFMNSYSLKVCIKAESRYEISVRPAFSEEANLPVPYIKCSSEGCGEGGQKNNRCRDSLSSVSQR